MHESDGILKSRVLFTIYARCAERATGAAAKSFIDVFGHNMTSWGGVKTRNKGLSLHFYSVLCDKGRTSMFLAGDLRVKSLMTSGPVAPISQFYVVKVSDLGKTKVFWKPKLAQKLYRSLVSCGVVVNIHQFFKRNLLSGL